jgi:hypothetical protein
MRAHRVRALLMGGQACVFYGGAEFSRDTDLAILADAANLARLRRALAELQAVPIAVPSLELRHLRRGHAVHFRCMHPDAPRMRVDIMSRMRGVDAFPALWRRRTTIEMAGGVACDLLSLPDLVAAKKTQRDKDWPMIRRLVEANYFQYRRKSSPGLVSFWLHELRTPELLVEAAATHPRAAANAARARAAVARAVAGDLPGVEQALRQEELAEREADREHWKPLIAELGRLRRQR